MGQQALEDGVMMGPEMGFQGGVPRWAEGPEGATRRFAEFFTVFIRNWNTRKAYWVAVERFGIWLGNHGVRLNQVEPLLVAAYV